MKHVLFLLLLLSNTAFGQKDIDALIKNFDSKTKAINIYSAYARYKDSSAVFLDAREREEYDISHVEGSIFVGHDAFTMASVQHLPKDTKIIIYCSLGYRSDNIGQKLKKAGYTNVYNLIGGVFQWSNKSYPLVNRNGSTEQIHGYDAQWSQYIRKGDIVY